jgi:hypothetical protein
MGALEDLAIQLLGQQSQQLIRAENPYHQFQAVPQVFGQAAMQAQTDGTNPRADMWSKSIAASLGGLLSGGLEGYGNNYQNVLTDRYNAALGQGIIGQEPSAEGLTPNLFGAAKQGATLFKVLRDAKRVENADATDDAVALQERLIDVEARKRLAAIMAEDAAWKAANGGGKPTAVVTKAAVPVATAANGSGAIVAEVPVVEAVPASELALPQGNPNNPYYKDEMDRATRTRDDSEKIRKEFNALPEVKNYSIVQKGAGIMAKALKDPSAVADQELVRYAILMIEPGMAVREGEQRAVAMSQSIPAAWKGALAKALNGEAELGPEIRAGLRRLAGRAYEGHKVQYDKALSFYQGRAQDLGLDPAKLSYLGESPSVKEVMGSPIPDVPQGYKLQQNKRTGDYRVVPK